MVQIVPNWAEMEGRVADLHPSEGLEDFVTMDLEVHGVTPLESPQLFEGVVGTTIPVNIRRDLAGSLGLEAGVEVRCRVRRGDLTTWFVDPEHVTVQPSPG